jgi:hypothetical protein
MMDTNNQPFWKDVPDVPQGKLAKSVTLVAGILHIGLNLIVYCGFTLLLSRWPIAMWAWIGFIVLIFAAFFEKALRTRKASLPGDEIQKLAQERLGALHIGSALHVAGHPLLTRDQPVVLALVSDGLSLYSYDSPIPLDVIPLKDIQSVQTVSYDDDRVPHADVVDSAAQAIQLTFQWRDQTCTCLFRRMKKMRPIDWYQALQQARLQAGLVK